MVRHRPGKASSQRPAAAGAIAAHFQQAVGYHQRGQLPEAEAAYRAILAQAPGHFDALHLLGIVYCQKREFLPAVESIRKAVDVDPRNPNKAAALSNLGIALHELHRSVEALASFDRSLAQKPDNPETHFNRANVLIALQRPADALAGFDRALALKPDYVAALNNRGNALLALHRNVEALAAFDRAAALAPASSEAHNNRGTALLALTRPDDAVLACDRALALKPDFPEALGNRGNALLALKRYREGAETFSRLLALSPGFVHALGNLLDCRLRSCDWTDLAALTERVVAAVGRGERAALPFVFLSASRSPAAQLACARTFVADKFPASTAPLWTGQRYRHDRVRVAYLSADFHDHATAYLIAGLFEAHDKDRFSITAVSFGPDREGPMRERLRRAFDEFVDVRGMDDRRVAQWLREREIDIAVDLKGFTANSRTGIFAHRGAPIQVNYLGYPGTMGAGYLDYIVADRHVIPPGHEAFFAEKVVRLPDSYQVNDARREIAEPPPTRAAAGLPDGAFVFCSFNNVYKITPDVFDIWMRLLRAVPGSVLWLLEDSADAAENLRRSASARDVAPERLVFAPTLPLDRHLARHRLADLFLDTRPVNAHTTASDALWAGSPVVTCIDDAFVGRVAASLLHAAGLPELITESLADYEALALSLATTPHLLAASRTRLAQNRDVCALFDTDRYRRHLEAAYLGMWERHQRGDAPIGFDVP